MQEYHCKFCLLTEKESTDASPGLNLGPLIRPCNCLSSRCHRACLGRWRAEKAESFEKCEVCFAPYQTRTRIAVSFETGKLEKQKFIQRTKNKILLYALVAVFCVLFCSSLSWKFDEDHSMADLTKIQNPALAYLFLGVFWCSLVFNILWLLYKCSGPSQHPTTYIHISGPSSTSHSSSSDASSSSSCGGSCSDSCKLVFMVLIILAAFFISLYEIAILVHKNYKEYQTAISKYEIVDLTEVVNLEEVIVSC